MAITIPYHVFTILFFKYVLPTFKRALSTFFSNLIAIIVRACLQWNAEEPINKSPMSSQIVKRFISNKFHIFQVVDRWFSQLHLLPLCDSGAWKCVKICLFDMRTYFFSFRLFCLNVRSYLFLPHSVHFYEPGRWTVELWGWAQTIIRQSQKYWQKLC